MTTRVPARTYQAKLNPRRSNFPLHTRISADLSALPVILPIQPPPRVAHDTTLSFVVCCRSHSCHITRHLKGSCFDFTYLFHARRALHWISTLFTLPQDIQHFDLGPSSSFVFFQLSYLRFPDLRILLATWKSFSSWNLPLLRSHLSFFHLN